MTTKTTVDTDEDAVDCLSCDRTFGSERGMKIHHSKEHAESLVKEVRDCVVCGEEFSFYPSQNESQRACSYECGGNLISEAKQQGETEECEYCGDEVDIEPWEREWKDSFFCDMDCKAEWQSEYLVGENSPSWKGGWDYWYGEDWPEVRQQALERDDHKCRICGRDESDIGRDPDVHHITPVRVFRKEHDDPNLANTLDNVITLCPVHHGRAEKGDLELPDLGAVS